MNASRGALRHAKGFTLLELMISVVILGLVVAYVLESFSRQHKAYTVTEQVVEAQQNLRAISHLIEREIRMAGYLVPDAAGICGLDSDSAPDQLFISESDPIVPDAVKVGDLGARVLSGYSNSATDQTWVLDTASADLDADGSFYYDNDGNGTADSDFRDRAGFILADAKDPSRGTVCGIVRDASPSNFQVTVVSGAFSPQTVAGEELVVVPAAHYRVTGNGRLERNQDLLALGVDDFQVSYFFDVDDNGRITSAATENPGVAGVALYDPQAWDNTDLKEVQVNVVVRSRADDPDFRGGQFVVRGNRTFALGPPPSDGFRRRLFFSQVRPRNIGAEGGI